MKIGVYLSGLGQSIANESVEKYATRLMNEMSFYTQGVDYYLKTELINYSQEKSSTVVGIYEKNGAQRLLYKLYDFKYHETLTERFTKKPLLVKNFWLFLMVIRKIPLILSRLFRKKGYDRPFQTLYLFFIFMMIASAVLLLLPASISLITNFWEVESVKEMKIFLGLDGTNVPFISIEWLENISMAITYATAIMILILPNANVLITDLATEFVCANDYLEHGAQRQIIQGQLEKLIDYITEEEEDCKIHFHSYSFGSILAIDYLYPFGSNISRNAEQFCEVLITIGSPYDFINSYYTDFYKNRRNSMDDRIYWLNIYSVADALASTFRKDDLNDQAQYGIGNSNHPPHSVNYEVTSVKTGVVSFIMLASLNAHSSYWDSKVDGQSCVRLVFEELRNQGLFPLLDQE